MPKLNADETGEPFYSYLLQKTQLFEERGTVWCVWSFSSAGCSGSCRRRRPTGNRGMPLMMSLLLLLLLLLLLMLLLSGRLQQLQLNAN